MKNQKLSKGILKEIVKECLIEILAEGLVSNNKQPVKSTKTLKESMLNSMTSSIKAKPSKKRPSYLDSINFDNKGGEKVKNEKLDEIASSVTKDPILSEMLKDTAHTTLQQQIAAENKKGFAAPGTGDEAQRIVESSMPEDLFGSASEKWASLAFGD